ncbi:putative ABC transport system permease protein [Caulobacter ginsengisoli]|uniref:ABC transport system permease protein n=1 Tax=Caulobacter ginsengisoli TaxID=400775 RepID=A0ABU0ISN9_9CAUL|nr:ABC transporter permease [Caulobacter ginsengisoli]MDQ0464173.1 putative ABC transport system permease protein [Caulobacter ginsengisoli]
MSVRRIDLVGFATGAIIAHPMRSALTSLGVVIGVAAVVMMTSIGLGAQKQVTSAIGGLGSNLLIVSPGASRGPGGGFVSQGAGTNLTLTEEDAKALGTLESVVAVAPSVRGGAQLTAEGANWNTRIEGVTPDYLVARDLTIASGRMIDEAEARQGRKVAVIGQTVATSLFGDSDPLGKRIRVGTVPFEVIGVLASKGQSGFGQDQDDIVLGPLEAVRSRVVGKRVKGDNVQTIYVKAADADSLDRVQEDATNLLRERHRIRQGADDDFNVQNLASITEALQSSIKTFTGLLAAVAAVSLLVGGVGIMNIMLVAVTERTREIGLRMAVGARRTDVLFQFALEAVVLSVVGGAIGLVLGIGGAMLMAKLGNWPTAIAGWSVPLSLGFSMLVGLVFGAYPSWRAARLDPIEALRRE